MRSNEALTALDFAVRVGAVGFTISALEQLRFRRRAFGPTGPFSEAMARVYGRGVTSHRILQLGFGVAQYSNVAVGLVLVVTGVGGWVGSLALVLALAGNMVVRLRRITASDGAEQMITLIFLAAFLGTVHPTGYTVELAVVFIAGQTLLCYLSAGLAKAVSHDWRDGGAVPLILGSQAHGHAGATRVLVFAPVLGRLLTWSVMAFELSFVLTLVSPEPVVVLLLAAGIAFHLGCAVLMGLNSFVWAFPATYACVWWVVERTSPWW